MDGFGGRERGGLLEYIKFMAARTEDAEDEREAAILMLVKKGGGNTENVASEEELCLMSVEEAPKGCVFQHHARNPLNP